MANNRDTVRHYSDMADGGTELRPNQSTVVIQSFHYDNFFDYNQNRSTLWNAFDAVRNMRGTRTTRSGEYTVAVLFEFPYVSDRQLVTISPDWFKQYVIDAIYGSGSIEDIFSRNNPHPLSASVVRLHDAVRPNNPRYRARGRIWGYIGTKLLDCVTKPMMDRVTYYTPSNDQRSYMWDPETDMPYPVDRSDPDYNPEAMRKLAQDQGYRKIKSGIEQYLHKRGLQPHDDYGFEPRDLCELAKLCDCRIVVWIDSGAFRVCRHDTDDLNNAPRNEEGRYAFHYHMMSDQHLEILPVETMVNDNRTRISLKENPCRDSRILYLSDAEFNEILTREGAKPVEDRRLYALCKAVKGSSRKYINMPEEAHGHEYSGWVLTSGENVYKHESLRDWTEDLLETGEYGKSVAARAISYSDLHAHTLRNLYEENNINPVYQNANPRLYHAIRWADMQFGHMQLRMDEGSIMHEYDGRKWYMTDFSEIEEFDYFHGIPMSDCWSEYDGVKKTVEYVPGQGFKERVTYIGNHPGDSPFTFVRGSKYAIFQVESLDLSGVSENMKAHFKRDRIFTEFDPKKDVMMLPSPVVHFLQDQGAVWRASRVWVCYGCGTHWVPDSPAGRRLERDMVEMKTYPVVMGRLMCGRNATEQITYIAPDPETANSLQYFYSLQFAHGRLQTEGRTSPDVILEGEEHEYENIDSLRDDTDPESVIYSGNGEFAGTTQVAFSIVKNGGYILPTAGGADWDGVSPFWVETFQSTYNWGRTYSHISGAQHAMCFVRLYQAVSKIQADDVVGFSLDSIRTRVDVTENIREFIGRDIGYFKPGVEVEYKCPVNRSTPMLSDLYTPKSHFRGINAPPSDTPAWNEYKDGLRQFNIITGKAGSGKTTRHFTKFGGGAEDFRLATNTVYMTMTNHLAHHMQSTLGVKSFTSYMGFNRSLGDDDRLVDPSRRYNVQIHRRMRKVRNYDDIDKLKGYHSIMLDEVSMIAPDKLVDIVEVCKAYHLQLNIVGDIDTERFFQLSPVGFSEGDFFDAIKKAEDELSVKFNWIEPMRVFRQAGDEELVSLLDELRELDGAESWNTLYESDLFRHISYEEMLEEFDSSKDLVAQPWHRKIAEVTSDVLERLGPEDTLKIRGNFNSPRRVKGEFEWVLSKMKLKEEDEWVYKGSTCKVTKEEFMELEGTYLMSKGFPYAGSSNSANEVNPMIGATIFNLQGLTLDENARIYIYTNARGFSEWIDECQPKLPYVAASRARRREQIVIVTGPNATRHNRKRARN